MVRAVLKAYDNGSPAVRDRIVNLFLKEFLTKTNRIEKMKKFEEEYGAIPPNFLTISPGGNCNLRCKDCYAASVSKGLPSLSFENVERILKEKYEK